MDKKTIISKTKLFICIILFIILFQKIFGNENTLIGVTVITATLMFMQRDFTANILRFFIIFSVINVGQGILAFLTQINPWIGIPATFISMFVTGYAFTYNLRAPMFIAFGLQYVFMVYSPITAGMLPIRLLSLFVGAIIIILSQLIVNIKRLEKSSNAILPGITKGISSKLDNMIKGEYKEEFDNVINTGIKNLRKAVHESRESFFHTTVEGKINLNISIALERINILIDRVFKGVVAKDKVISQAYVEFFQDIKDVVDGINLNRHNKIHLQEEVNKIESFINKYNLTSNKDNLIQEGISHDNIREILESMDFIMHNILEAFEIGDKKYKKYSRKTSIPEHFRIIYVMKKHFNLRSIKFSYAFRSALLITISIFIVKYFNIPDGKWLVFTILSIVQPYEQSARIKSWHRLKGTFMGIIIFVIAFSVIIEPTLRIIIIIMAGYISSYQKTYDREMICITFSALGAAAITGDTNVLLAFHRGLYVALGIGISVLANKFILPFRNQDGNNSLINIYNQIINEVKREISLSNEGKSNIQNMRNLIMQTSLIEDRLDMNLSFEDDAKKEEIGKMLHSNRILINDLYDEYLGNHRRQKA